MFIEQNFTDQKMTKIILLDQLNILLGHQTFY